jgi:hypothetical protein
MIYREGALAHHLLQVPVGELIPAISADTQEEDDRRLEVTPLERGLRMLHEGGSGSRMA